MSRMLASRDSVALAGSIVGAASMFAGWFTFKASRISAGTSLSLWEISPGAGAAISVLWLALLGASLLGRKKNGMLVAGLAANLALIAALLLAGAVSTRLLVGEGEIARVSLGAGFWLCLAGAHVVAFASRRSLRDSAVLRNLVTWSGATVFLLLLFTGWFNDLSIAREFMGREARFWQELRNHVFLFAGSVGIGTLIGVPLGIWATRSKRIAAPVFYITSIVQTIPSLALFGLLIAPLSALSFAFPVLRELGIRGVGATPAIIALVMYSLLPIARNTHVGLRQVSPAVVDAGLGMGMSRREIFLKIEAPLAAPLVLEGIRTASVQAVGLVAVAALIGAGGLGWFIFQGLGQAAEDLILLGALPVIALALVVDALMRTIVRITTPRGLGVTS